MAGLVNEFYALKGAPGLIDAAGFPAMLAGAAPENVIQRRLLKLHAPLPPPLGFPDGLAASLVSKHGFKTLWSSAEKCLLRSHRDRASKKAKPHQ